LLVGAGDIVLAGEALPPVLAALVAPSPPGTSAVRPAPTPARDLVDERSDEWVERIRHVRLMVVVMANSLAHKYGFGDAGSDFYAGEEGGGDVRESAHT
jgi:hypothetical protein